jgi:hypothetical protein
LGRILDTTAEPIVGLRDIRVLSDGRLLVNDFLGRRVLLFDSALWSFSVVIDSATAIARTYPTSPPTLLAFAGDSTALFDLWGDGAPPRNFYRGLLRRGCGAGQGHGPSE